MSLIEAGAVIASAVSFCCAVRPWLRAHLIPSIVSLVALVAMLDHTTVTRVPGIIWAVVLIASAPVLAVHRRIVAGRRERRGSLTDTGQSLMLVAMAAMILPHSAHAASAAHAHLPGGLVPLVTTGLVAFAAAIVATAWWRAIRRRRLSIEATENGAMLVMILFMAVGALIPPQG